MPIPVNRLDIHFKGEPVKIQIMDVVGQRIYKVNFPATPPLFITRAKNADGVYFWTSVPEGKQKLAEEIGALIEPLLKEQ
jgi:hypothetical protein